jgi:hypothetical protein
MKELNTVEVKDISGGNAAGRALGQAIVKWLSGK